MDSDNVDDECSTNEQFSQEPLLKFSASQLVELMTCAMKRKASQSTSAQDTQSKKICLSSTSHVEAEPNHDVVTRLCKSNQTLIERNEYLEKRVRELEALNYNLQFGIVDSVKKSVVETMEAQFKMNNSVTRKQKSKPISHLNKNVGCSSQQPQTWQHDSNQEETMISSVTSTTMKSSEPLVEELNSSVVVDIDNKNHNNSEQFMSSHGSVVQYIKPEDDQNNDAPVEIYEHDRVLGMAHEIQTIVRDSTNYKKLTNRLLNALFDHDELAGSTLTGKFKGEYQKEKLDEDTVNLIVQQAVARFPGTSTTDIRIVISQNCKDKALRMQRKHAKMLALMVNNDV